MICCRKPEFYHALLRSIDFSLIRTLKWLNTNSKTLSPLVATEISVRFFKPYLGFLKSVPYIYASKVSQISKQSLFMKCNASSLPCIWHTGPCSQTESCKSENSPHKTYSSPNCYFSSSFYLLLFSLQCLQPVGLIFCPEFIDVIYKRFGSKRLYGYTKGSSYILSYLVYLQQNNLQLFAMNYLASHRFPSSAEKDMELLQKRLT